MTLRRRIFTFAAIVLAVGTLGGIAWHWWSHDGFRWGNGPAARASRSLATALCGGALARGLLGERGGRPSN